jgi:hypothetical protein
MGLVYSSYGGLMLAENAADESAVSRALRQLDPDLRLVWKVDDETGRQVYRVFKYMGDSQPAAFIMDWREHGVGAPLPLTHRLVDEVKNLRIGSRAPQRDPLAENDKLEAAVDREWQEALAEQVRDGERRMRRAPCFKPSVALRMSRDKQRRRGLNL